MALIDTLGEKNLNRRGMVGPPPEKGFKGFWFLFINHFWKLVALNLLFLSYSVPIFTAPAAMCGMNRALVKLVRDGNCFVWPEFIKEFKANLLKSLPFGILYAFLMFDSYFAFSLTFTTAEGGFRTFAIGAGLVLLGFAAVFCGYVFVLLPSVALTNRQIARNALFLMLLEWKTSLVILASSLVFYFIALAFFPYSLLLLLFLGFALLQLIVCFVVNGPMQRRIVAPFEANRACEAKGGGESTV